MTAVGACRRNHRFLRRGDRHRRKREEQVVQPPHALLGGAVMAPDTEAGGDEGPRDEKRHPAALGELEPDGEAENGRRQQEPRPVHRQAEFPFLLRPPVLPPVQDHPELRESEGQEHVDRVHDDEVLDRSAGDIQHQQRHAAHEDDAVIPHQALGQVGEASGRVIVERHVGEHLRAVDDAGLRRDEQESRLRSQHHRQQDFAAAPLPEVPHHPPEEDGVQRPPGAGPTLYSR